MAENYEGPILQYLTEHAKVLFTYTLNLAKFAGIDMKKDELRHMRVDFQNEVLRKKDLLPDPIEQFRCWVSEASQAFVPEANAFVLSTIDDNGFPDARVVLLKSIEDEGIVFFTNYNSTKGKQIEKNTRVSANFLWKPLHKQVRFKGICTKVDPEISDEYFKLRPVASRLSALASPQSDEVANRSWLEKAWQEMKAKYGDDPERPDHWGGYLITIESAEFWQGRPNRLHDRFRYVNDNGSWKIVRLAP